MVDQNEYMEIIRFLVKSGGRGYQPVDDATCKDILHALDDGRYRLVRDEDGNITGFTTWWLINHDDLDTVKHGGKPSDVSTGSIIFIADHAGKGDYPGLIKFLSSHVTVKGVCWHHRYNTPEQFRYFPNQEGKHA